MSNRVMTWVFEQSPATGNDRLVLIAIADEADDDGTNAYPSIDRIAMKARVNKRTTMRCLERLEAAGGLVVHRPEKRGRGHYNTYVVVMEKGDTLTPDPDGERARNGDSADEKGRATARGDARTVLDPLTLGTDVPDPLPRSSRATACPTPFMLTADMRAWAAEHAPAVDPSTETAQFTDHHRAKGSTYKDWQAAWRTWMRNAQKWSQQRGGSGAGGKPNVTDRNAEAAEKFLTVMRGGRS